MLAARPAAKVEVELPCTVRKPVVVAPPEIVRPVVWAPPPIVEDAFAIRPAVNWMRVDVELPSAVGVNGNCAVRAALSEELETLLLKVVQSAEVRKPLVEPDDA